MTGVLDASHENNVILRTDITTDGNGQSINRSFIPGIRLGIASHVVTWLIECCGSN
jgi:hypothetical protein